MEYMKTFKKILLGGFKSEEFMATQIPLFV